MGSESPQLHVFFLPFVGKGHMLPMMDTAKLFAARGVRATLILTPLGASVLGKSVEGARASGYSLDLHLMEYPPEADLPGGDENPDKIKSPESKAKLFRALRTLERPFEKLVEEHRPDVIVSDVFFPWSVNVAAKFGIPRLSFSGFSFFALSVFDALRRHSPHAKVERDDEPFLVPGLPDQIELTRGEIPGPLKTQTNVVADLWAHIHLAEENTYGEVMNSFYELERDYVEHVRRKIGKRAWHVGPVFLCNRDDSSETIDRKTPAGADDCLTWLDTQKPDSVLYMCFGSLCKLTPPQLRETASALESSGCAFVWVVKQEEELPEGFEERTEGRGFVIRGWAPQIRILSHRGVGGFATHCGWNSVLEGVTAGKPMITWPVFAEQFFNEKLITKALGIGVGVGVGSCSSLDDLNNRPVIKKEAIERAVRSVMSSEKEEAKRMRAKAREYAEMGKRAVQKGGSSYTDLVRLIEEMKVLSIQKRSTK